MNRPDMAAAFDTVILMIPQGYAGVNVASRLIASMRQDAPDLRIVPVMAAYRQDAGLSRKDIERGIGMAVAAVLPRDDAGLRRAHRAAKPLVEMQPRSPYTRAVQSLWQDATRAAEPVKARSKPVWARFFAGKVAT